MVLWELTLATAYVLGLKRTYRLAIRAQKRVFGSKYPRIRDFTERRTKAVFTIALNVHQEIQRRDISVGRSVGNWLLRFLDRARPQANIRGSQINPSHPRPAPPRLEGSSTKNGQSKRTGVGLNDSADSGTSMFTSNFRGPFGPTLRSRITNGLKLRTRPLVGPFPALSSFGLWWQPVRREFGGAYSIPNYSFPGSSLSRNKVVSVPFLQPGLVHRPQTVFREDIARLMRAQ